MSAASRSRRLLLVLEAAIELTRARMEVRLLSDDRLLRRLGVPAVPSRTEAQGDGASDIGWAVTGMAKRLPGDSTCLAQALAGQRMLSRRRLANELHLGVSSGKELRAHAWLTSAGSPVVGQSRAHTPVVALTRTSRPT
jgi:hypothetical protein